MRRDLCRAVYLLQTIIFAGEGYAPQSILFPFPASGDFCRLLILFANSLDPDQAGQNVGPDLDPNCLIL